MKNKILSIICLVVLAVSVNNCESEENARVTTPNGFLQLDSEAATLAENSGDVITTSVLLGTNVKSTDVTVNFTVTSSDASRYTFSPASGTLVIPAGEVSADITFEAVDNDDQDGDIDVVLSLSETSDLPIGIGGQGVNGVSKTISIIDDNVPCNNVLVSVTTDRWGSETSWQITDDMGAIVASDGPYEDLPSNDDLPTINTTVNLDDGCYTFTIFDSYGDGMDVGSYIVTCGALIHAQGGGDLADGNMSESTDFCVNQ